MEFNVNVGWITHPHVASGRAERRIMRRSTDANAGRVAIADVEFCFNYDGNDESCGRVDWMGG